MKRTTFYNLVIAFLILATVALSGCQSAESSRIEAAKSFAQETSIATYEGHDYLVWVHQAYRPTGEFSYISGITHSASCKNPEHKQTTATASPTPKR